MMLQRQLAIRLLHVVGGRLSVQTQDGIRVDARWAFIFNLFVIEELGVLELLLLLLSPRSGHLACDFN